MLMVCPLSMPAGTLTTMRVFLRTRPEPLQSGHGSLMILPVPRQAEQGRVDVNEPRIVFCCVRTWPVPPQAVQRTGSVPGRAPLPPPAAPLSSRGMSPSRRTPSAASSTERVRL